MNARKLREMMGGKEVSKWISVKDRLPKKRVKVLCFLSWGRDDIDIRIGFQQDGAFGDYSGGEWIRGLVTHWMPLPEPPK